MFLPDIVAMRFGELLNEPLCRCRRGSPMPPMPPMPLEPSVMLEPPVAADAADVAGAAGRG